MKTIDATSETQPSMLTGNDVQTLKRHWFMSYKIVLIQQSYGMEILLLIKWFNFNLFLAGDILFTISLKILRLSQITLERFVVLMHIIRTCHIF